MLTLTGQGQNLTPGQGHVPTQLGHVAYQSMHLGEANTLGPSPVPYLYSTRGQRLANRRPPATEHSPGHSTPSWLVGVLFSTHRQPSGYSVSSFSSTPFWLPDALLTVWHLTKNCNSYQNREVTRNEKMRTRLTTQKSEKIKNLY